MRALGLAAFATIGAIVGVALLSRDAYASDVIGGDLEDFTLGDLSLDGGGMAAADFSTSMNKDEPDDMNASEQNNLRAFLAMIRQAEGTADPDGYRRMTGGKMFTSLADHPRQIQTVKFGNGKTVRSDAAGAYQYMSFTWDDVKRALGLTDFSPESQDRGAVWLIQQKGALVDVMAGRFNEAINKVRSVWASLPGAGYGQPEQNLATLREVYLREGGRFAS